MRILPPPIAAAKHEVRSIIDQIRFDMIKSKRSERKVMNNVETIDYILKHKCSISRYGDGELDLAMAGKYGTPFHSGFQAFDAKLSQRLVEILDYRKKVDNHLVCLPACSFTYGTSYLRKPARDFWNQYTTYNIDRFLAMTSADEVYGETNISRLYLSHRDKSKCKDFVKSMKQIWQGRDVVFVEGNKTHLGYGNDLFDNAQSIHRILCPNDSAFKKYDEILNAVLANTHADTLIILALGMTATILAYDLAANGRQALDLGHIDIEYEWMRMGAKEKVAIPGKFTNEAKGGKNLGNEYPTDFKEQIIVDVS
ncbi:MAG: GT-D fold domain-containing glycosyltransferase [Alloprevotella sp.]|nr:GT-D fold domain-containing glycosyltransferase [Alloprevotella sp.]